VVVEAGVGAPVCLALGIQGNGCAGQAPGSWKGVLQAVGRVVEAGGGGGAQEVLHLLQRAVGPVEAPGGSPQVAHHVSVLPGAGLGPWGAPKVGGSSIAIMDSS